MCDFNFRMITRLVSFLLWCSCTFAIASCSATTQTIHKKDSDRQQAPEVSHPKQSDDQTSTSLTIKDLKINGWWWPEHVVREGFNGDNPPPKDQYIEIKKWQYDGDGLTTSPHQVDFLSTVVNNSRERFEGKLVFKVSFRFEDENLYTRDPKDGKIEFHQDVFETLPWMDESSVLSRNVTVNGKEELSVNLKEFDITKILNKTRDGKSICALRLVAQITDESGRAVDSKETIMLVVMGI